ncbi:hypothetical protein ACFPN2_12340 [Steroidobacter flavus]|uniref:Uncharacterized protein n=1 Tax=Steroidobacter flavus TaxID=1842136 RepID=A0ABV8SSB5_9GAMM
MMSKKWMAAVALLTMSTGALAQDGTFEFDSITSLTRAANAFTGVLVGDTVPTTVTMNYGSLFGDKCFSWMELMMTEPGKFTLTITLVSGGSGTTGSPWHTDLTLCRLTAKP